MEECPDTPGDGMMHLEGSHWGRDCPSMRSWEKEKKQGPKCLPHLIKYQRACHSSYSPRIPDREWEPWRGPRATGFALHFNGLSCDNQADIIAHCMVVRIRPGNSVDGQIQRSSKSLLQFMINIVGTKLANCAHACTPSDLKIPLITKTPEKLIHCGKGAEETRPKKTSWKRHQTLSS